MRGHPLQHGGGGAFRLEPLRERHQARRRDGLMGSVGAHRSCPGDAIARFEVAHALAHRLHRARAFLPGDERQRHLVGAAALVDVDEIDPRRLHAHQDLARLGLRRGKVLKLHLFGAALRLYADRFHARLSPRRAPDVKCRGAPCVDYQRSYPYQRSRRWRRRAWKRRAWKPRPRYSR